MTEECATLHKEALDPSETSHLASGPAIDEVDRHTRLPQSTELSPAKACIGSALMFPYMREAMGIRRAAPQHPGSSPRNTR